jgi:hypothetical protein
VLVLGVLLPVLLEEPADPRGVLDIDGALELTNQVIFSIDALVSRGEGMRRGKGFGARRYVRYGGCRRFRGGAPSDRGGHGGARLGLVGDGRRLGRLTRSRLFAAEHEPTEHGEHDERESSRREPSRELGGGFRSVQIQRLVTFQATVCVARDHAVRWQ